MYRNQPNRDSFFAISTLFLVEDGEKFSMRDKERISNGNTYPNFSKIQEQIWFSYSALWNLAESERFELP